MSAQLDIQALLAPISDAQPCGLNLDDTPILATFDALRLFGQAKSPEAPPDAEDGDKDKPKEKEKVKPPPEWDQIRANALEALTKSKDLRVLAYLGTASLRTDGLPAFAQVLTIAAHWLETYWAQVYPLIDEDAVARRNALNCLADPMAVVDRVWRLPLVVSRQHGRFSLRDIDIAGGVVLPGAMEARPDETAIRGAFGEMSIEELTALDKGITAATAALNSIDARMRSEGGPEVAPEFAPLSTQFAKLNRVFSEQLALRSAASGAGATIAGGAGAVAFVGGVINSRQDAVRALDAVAEFFRRNEPSSPIPLFVDRAKRLVSKDFLEVLADVAPEALVVARSAGGLKADQ
jgi:type VI secretion system protein ImpA